jgi:hypothetical protein
MATSWPVGAPSGLAASTATLSIEADSLKFNIHKKCAATPGPNSSH